MQYDSSNFAGCVKYRDIFALNSQKSPLTRYHDAINVLSFLNYLIGWTSLWDYMLLSGT